MPYSVYAKLLMLVRSMFRLYVYVSAYVYEDVNAYVCVCICICICMCICTCTCICCKVFVCICVYIYVCIYIYKYRSWLRLRPLTLSSAGPLGPRPLQKPSARLAGQGGNLAAGQCCSFQGSQGPPPKKERERAIDKHMCLYTYT